MILWFQKPESARNSFVPLAPGTGDTRDQFFNKPQRAPRRVRRPFPGADVQHLAGPSAGCDDRVIPALVGVPVAGALLVRAVDLADKRIDIHDQSPVARAGTSDPRAPQALCQHPVKLADMPERERAQERPKRRGCRDAMPEHRAGLSRAQHVTVLDAISPERHRRDQAHYLPSSVRCPRPLAKINRLLDQRLDSQPIGEHRRQDHPSVSHNTLIIKRDHQSVRRTVHHAGDLLRRTRSRWHGPSCLLRRSAKPQPRTDPHRKTVDSG